MCAEQEKKMGHGMVRVSLIYVPSCMLKTCKKLENWILLITYKMVFHTIRKSPNQKYTVRVIYLWFHSLFILRGYSYVKFCKKKKKSEIPETRHWYYALMDIPQRYAYYKMKISKYTNKCLKKNFQLFLEIYGGKEPFWNYKTYTREKGVSLVEREYILMNST